MPEPRRVRIVIVGGGFAGIGMAIRLRARGIRDFVILERAAALGGTWRENSYPGCACDVESLLYQFSFAQNPDWSHAFAPQGEIWAYLQQVADRYDIVPHCVFGQNVTGAAWDESAKRWTVTAGSTSWSAEQLILANGQLSDPVIPDLPGLSTFRGRVFHSARWDHEFVLRGKRVAVIGTGASAIQFVPAIQPEVERLELFQRTPPWIMPRHDHPISPWRRALFRALPVASRMVRGLQYLRHEVLFLPFRHLAFRRVAEWIAGRHLAAQVPDPAFRARLRPHYGIGCKRILLSDDYLPALTRPNVDLITDPITSIVAEGVVTDDGRTRMVDAIIFGTGFRVTDPLLAPHLTGRDGRSLADAWQGSPTAYMGTTVAGFPNLFLLMGPNTGLGHSSVLLTLEAQFEHVLGVLKLLEERSARTVEPSVEAQSRYVASIDSRFARTVWLTGGCQSWYLDRTGRNSTLWPDGVRRFRRAVTRVRPADYRFSDA